MAILGILYIAIAWVWIQYLPGYFVSRAMVPDARGMKRHGLALVCGFSVTPLIVFLLTVAASIPMDAPLVWLVSTAINIGGAAIIVPPNQWKNLDLNLRDTAILTLACIVVAVFLLFGLRSLDGGDVFSTVHHCLYVIVMHTIGNDPSISVPLYDWISDDIIHYLVHHPTTEFNGLAPLFFEQRLGNAAILAPTVALFGSAGWYVTTVYASMVTGVCVWLAAREINVRPAAATIAAGLFVYGMHIFLAYFVNENIYATALVAFLLWAALKKEFTPGWIILIGVVCGHLVGVRYTSCLFWPAVAVAVLWQAQPFKANLKQFALGATFAVLFLLPWLYVNFIMLGDPVTHPKVHSEFAGRIVNNTLLGWEFEFRALNWPFIDHISRTAWNPFPSFIWLALWCGLCFGQIGLAFGAMGTWATRTAPRQLILLLLFAVPHSLAITLLESLDWEQITYAAPGLVPLAVFMAKGIDPLFDVAYRKRHAIITVVVCIAIAGLSRSLRAVDFPVDTRILPTQHWPEAPTHDRGSQSVGERLTSVSPLPRAPVLRTNFAASMWGAFGHVFSGRSVPIVDELPVYPSGQVAVLAGYAARQATGYTFVMDGGTLRTADTPVRTSLGLHLVSFRLPAKQVKVTIQRDQGSYAVDFNPIGPKTELHDFSFWLHPWFPPVKTVRVTQAKEMIPRHRLLTYGGTQADGEQRFIVTNYPSDILDVIDVPYAIDANGEPMHCGLFLFTYSVDPTHVETLVLAGGHDQSWHGSTKGKITIPRNILADTAILYSEPYCSDHVPQYGDRYGLIKGPFSPENTLNFKLSEMW